MEKKETQSTRDYEEKIRTGVDDVAFHVTHVLDQTT